jgi:hypothetical protein
MEPPVVVRDARPFKPRPNRWSSEWLLRNAIGALRELWVRCRISDTTWREALLPTF